MNYINLDYLKQITYNDKALMQKLLNSYLERIPAGIQKLSEAYDRQDWEEMSAIAHEMQSSAGIVGNDALRSELQSLEYHINTEGEPKNIPILMKKIEKSHLESYEKIKKIAVTG